jgi:hypothetical protein
MLNYGWKSAGLANCLRACTVVLGLLLGGCTESQRQTLMGEGFNDEFAKSGEKMRNFSNGGEYDGLSTKSRQIENDLGVR